MKEMEAPELITLIKEIEKYVSEVTKSFQSMFTKAILTPPV